MDIETKRLHHPAVVDARQPLPLGTGHSRDQPRADGVHKAELQPRDRTVARAEHDAPQQHHQREQPQQEDELRHLIAAAQGGQQAPHERTADRIGTVRHHGQDRHQQQQPRTFEDGPDQDQHRGARCAPAGKTQESPDEAGQASVIARQR